MGRRFLKVLLIISCFLLGPLRGVAQSGLVIVKPNLDECSRTNLVINLFRKTPAPDKVLFILKDSNEQDAKVITSQELNRQTDGKYHWSGVIPFRDYVAELYSIDKKSYLGRYSFNTENSVRVFITSKHYEIIQLRQEDRVINHRVDNQTIQITNIDIKPRASLMQILIITEKGGIVAQYLGNPIHAWNSPEEVPVGTYRGVVLQFGANGCRLT